MEGPPERDVNVYGQNQREPWRKTGGGERVPEKSGPPAFPPHMVTTGSWEARTGRGTGPRSVNACGLDDQ